MKKLTDEERRERSRESNRRYRLKNKDKTRESNRLYRLKNKDRYQYYLKNKTSYDGEIEPPELSAFEKQILNARIAKLKRKCEKAIKEGKRYGSLSV
ncbi:hypothetical protein C0030_006140 [Candidatus Liberibacter solanacearum]|uniref:Uncharacterized protein n=1 Tax=Candidatus Liberibacter solanacearum TaxID=556287 RepID=A0A3R7P7R0_9HYPH|nr:hypothetical protein [Candidatus Liberibacter solanacearum]RPD36741.1 hypothetical protein C0030_006140 [Candidatus Liberibacter solanacearum]